jgi:predicted metalloprotease with PDZ domain
MIQLLGVVKRKHKQHPLSQEVLASLMAIATKLTTNATELEKRQKKKLAIESPIKLSRVHAVKLDQGSAPLASAESKRSPHRDTPDDNHGHGAGHGWF